MTALPERLEVIRGLHMLLSRLHLALAMNQHPDPEDARLAAALIRATAKEGAGHAGTS